MFSEIYLFLIITLSAFLQTTTGFGFAIATAPLLALVLGPKVTVMITLVASLVVKLMILRVSSGPGAGSFREIWQMALASMLGGIPGAYVLSIISNQHLKLFIGVILLLTGITLWREIRITIKNDRLARVITGGVSGFLGATTSVNGPPIVWYYLNAGAEYDKKSLRGNMTRYFFLSNIVSLVYSLVAGTLNISIIWRELLLCIPALWLGFYLGEKFFNKIDAPLFRKMTLGMVFISSIMLIGSTILNWF